MGRGSRFPPRPSRGGVSLVDTGPMASRIRADSGLSNLGRRSDKAGDERQQQHFRRAGSDRSQRHSRARDRRGGEGQVGPPRHRDGARTADPRPLHAGVAPRSHRPSLGRPGSLCAFLRPCIDAALRATVPRRLRAHPRRHQGLSPTRVGHAGSPRATAHRRR